MSRSRGVPAVVINILVLIALLVVVGLLFHKTYHGTDVQSFSNGTQERSSVAGIQLTGVSAIVWFVLAAAYLIIPKVCTGQTIGRWLVGGRTA